MLYCLADVGLLQSDRGKSLTTEGTVFKYEGLSYIQLDDSLNVKILLKDVKCLPEYDLLQRTDASDSETIYLGLFLRRLVSGGSEELSYIRQRWRMVETFFEQLERHDFVRLEELQLQDENAVSTGNALSIDQFYQRLREAHVGDVLDESIPENVSHTCLRPTLRPYQIQAIRWMLDRETVQKVLPAQYLKLRNCNIPNIDFYMHLNSFQVVDEMPREIIIPPGGILADEMGMGKTVEILGLILFNRKSKKRKRQEELNDEKEETGLGKKMEIRCICSSNSTRNLIACQKCGLMQHKKCVLKNCVQERKSYICPECWRSEPLFESGTTIIVSPVSIKMQWASEIAKHVNDRSFKIFIYEGVSASGWISPIDLAQYDVVLTDYNVLKTEIYFTVDNMRTSRHEKKFLRLVSPLPLVKWWRVCLDEAQMVEGVHNQTTKMVKTLPAVHRWTVTGTPIEKSMDNLYGLVHFLDYAPYNDYRIWCEFIEQFQQCNPRPLIHVISRIMWRTCKAAVLDQLGIPPQTEMTHYIAMSDLQNFFYRMEHAKCASAFREKAAKFTDRETSMARLNIHTLNLLMEPLRKLRQDCTIPCIMHRLDQTTTTKMLNPTELHDHLISKNEIDCKTQIRSIVSNLNGMAAIHVIRKEYSQAINMYKSVLRWADDYKGSICVDSLLQIHALHNLVEVLRMQEEREVDEIIMEEIAGYEKQCTKLEWKYIETHSNLVKNVEQELNHATIKIEEAFAQLNKKIDGSWWRAIIHQVGRNPIKITNFMIKLNVDIRDHNPMARQIDSVRGLDYTLTVWFDKVMQHRNQLKKAFKSIDYFITNLRPKHLWSAHDKSLIEKLVREAFMCHLDKELDDLPHRERSMRPTCVLCQVKSVLTQYECVIFDMEVVESSNPSSTTTKGTWQMTTQELMLRQIHVISKRENLEPEIIAEGDLYISYLENLKAEFKQYSKYWVEINYTAAAYDELNMCRSRLEVVTLEELDHDITNKTIQQILDIEVDESLHYMQTQKAASEKEFVRLQGTLKYLNHLGSVREIDICPICRYPPKEKYAVLQCGHHLCIICASQILRMNRNGNIDCVVCRNRQRVADIFYVTCNKLNVSKDIIVQGQYSSKIIKIVEIILHLKQKEPEVKVIIFSHWDAILLVLAEALKENSISYRMRGSKFYKLIEEFKDYQNDITCMLLPLKYGSKGLNLIEATHVFLVEPILNPGEELQAIGRVHRIGQTKPTFVHRFIMQNTIEETIHNTIQNDQSGLWSSKQVTVGHLEKLFQPCFQQSSEAMFL